MNQTFEDLKKIIFENKFSTLLFSILILSTIWLKEVNFLFYETLESPDIDKYFVYLVKQDFDSFKKDQILAVTDASMFSTTEFL